MWEAHAERFPDAPALIQGDRRFSWSEFDRRADGIAAALVAGGAGHQDKVTQYLYNCPEFLETIFACFKAALVPVNTNYRYADDELVYLWDNADVVAAVFHGTFSERIEGIRERVPKVRMWLWVDDGSGPRPDWALDYADAVTSASERVGTPWERSGDDLYLLYTGGTTGMPKGVMWRQDDIFMTVDAASRQPIADEPSQQALHAKVTKPGPRTLPAAPLMHGTGAFNSFNTLQLAGSVSTLRGRRFDVTELLGTIERERINSLTIVGDAFAKPMVAALDAEPERWDISHLRVIVSSGIMWSSATKAGLLRHNARLILVDALGSSEAIGMATATTTADSAHETARFKLGPSTRVLTEDGRDVVAGSGERGRVALGGRMPLGYYKDDAKTTSTFQVVDGVRYSIPGDWAEVDADGNVKLLGRGSQVINTGGEKVYPEEVEEILKTHDTVHDAVVVGVPDERFGQAIVGFVEPEPDAIVDEAELIDHVKSRLASYKSPRWVFRVESIGRAPNGKVDYRRWGADAKDRLGVS